MKSRTQTTLTLSPTIPIQKSARWRFRWPRSAWMRNDVHSLLVLLLLSLPEKVAKVPTEFLSEWSQSPTSSSVLLYAKQACNSSAKHQSVKAWEKGYPAPFDRSCADWEWDFLCSFSVLCFPYFSPLAFPWLYDADFTHSCWWLVTESYPYFTGGTVSVEWQLLQVRNPHTARDYNIHPVNSSSTMHSSVWK